MTESLGGMHEAVARAAEVAAGRDDVFRPDQFTNPANPEIHRRTTAEEIWRDTGGSVDVLVAGVGTGGTITGAGERLKERNPDASRGGGRAEAARLCSPGGPPGPHESRGSAPASCPTSSTGR